MKVWQIASGEEGRRYTDLFLEYDVMFRGPGIYGPYDKTKYSEVVRRKEFTSQHIGQLRRFCTEVEPGDIVLLRQGNRVLSLGVVEKRGYQWDERFEDIYGWDLQHSHRVIWQNQLANDLKAIESKHRAFAHMRSIPTFTQVWDEKVLVLMRPLFDRIAERALKPLPQEPSKPLTSEELRERLFLKGVSYDAVGRVATALEKLRGLVGWYSTGKAGPRRPTEHEVRAHGVLPLLLALGWSEQLLAVEWRNIDIAVFNGTPTDERTCKLVCEAKTPGHGLQNVPQQAMGYVAKKKLSACDKILVTNGQRFYLYRRKGEEWNQEPSGYLNIFKIRESHVHPRNTDAVQTLVDLAPMSIDR